MQSDEDKLRQLCETQLGQISALKEAKENATAKLIESQTKWTCFAKDILAISKELLKAIRTLQANNPVPEQFLTMSEDRIEKYEEFLNDNELAFSSTENPTTAASENTTNYMAEESQPRIQANLAPTSTLPALDYSKIKTYLKQSNDDDKICALLQALKLRLIKTVSVKHTKQIIQCFITYDLFDCADPSNELLIKLLRHPNKK